MLPARHPRHRPKASPRLRLAISCAADRATASRSVTSFIGRVTPNTMRLDALEVVADDIDAVGGAPAGESGVGRLAVGAVVDEKQGDVDGRTLGFVDRRGVAVRQVPGAEVAMPDLDGAALVGEDGQRAPTGVDLGDGAARAVEESDGVVVAAGDDVVAHAEVPTGDLQRVVAEEPGVDELGAGTAVEGVDL